MPILPDILEPNLAVVFCGSAAGNVSAARGAYYAHPQNRFWRALHEVGLTDRLLAPEEFRLLPRWRIGLTDLAKEVSGLDAQIGTAGDDPDALRDRVLLVRPRILAFAAKRPGAVFIRHVFGRRGVEYGRQAETLDGVRLFVLPSPSPAAVRYWDIAPWRALAEAVRGADDAPATGGGGA
jgi:TDG/mug DNA glycosylase family protein